MPTGVRSSLGLNAPLGRDGQPQAEEPGPGASCHDGTAFSFVALQEALESAKARKASRPPIAVDTVINLRQAVRSAKARKGSLPSSPTRADILRQTIRSAEERKGRSRSHTASTLLLIVRSAEERQACPASPPATNVPQCIQFTEKCKATTPYPPFDRKYARFEPIQSPEAGGQSPPNPSPVDPPPTSKKRAHGCQSASEDKTSKTPGRPLSPELEHGALAKFFAYYRQGSFIYDPDELPPLEFKRLVQHLGLRGEDPESRPLYEAFGRAMTAEFGIKFGKNMDDLEAWQKLCKRIGINPIPTTLKEARAEFKATHVNIVELMWTRIPDGGMEKFDTEEELAAYTRSMPGRTFPRKFVERKGILSYLLRRIWSEE